MPECHLLGVGQFDRNEWVSLAGISIQTPRHNAFVNMILNSSAHVIGTIRTNQERAVTLD